ncbi:DUF3017 domain-containing protein [Mumia sp. zg.B53]|uniref:DUF3017 domain-containing protein n=1 Tax=unclassified Mumia TaxID=2621872 RepID=UPI001C6DF674|nr:MULTISPECIES: DUF3017 domain-containing protein [unclassified Mumia]MBW9204782.1 DUF3017 domain-containing protein [Mumia sp. zg.B17]MBW9209213.1 DUF3017 domain-containing protein [Mumia sp. zg.B21]MBW9213823.1 DUF3017 domain-containing protein [Mumia sp. zg.B53]MDD9348622.1 DUF3017 domain-containing protein [Mumia sp.]
MSRREGLTAGTQMYAALVVAVVVGLALVAFGAWRQGIILLGGALVLGGAVRAVLPEPRTGLLRVRGRVFDTAWMLFLGSGLVTLAFVVPPGIGS